MVTSRAYERAPEQIKGWPAEVRLHFAQDVLRSLLPVVREAGTPDKPAEPPGDDKLLRHMHRMEKYG